MRVFSAQSKHKRDGLTDHPPVQYFHPDILSADYPYYIEKNIKEREGANVVFVMGAELAITTEGELTNVEGESDLNNIKKISEESNE